MNKQHVGVWGERLAAEHLIRSGWTILRRNYRSGRKEIDLIAERQGIVAFVEVKARTSDAFGDPLAAIVATKKVAIQEVASAWIASQPLPIGVCRFDVICVTDRPEFGVQLRHIENAWGL